MWLRRDVSSSCMRASAHQVEIYNETLFDLLRDSRPEQPDEGKPQIRETVEKQIVLENVIVQQADSSEQVSEQTRQQAADDNYYPRQ